MRFTIAAFVALVSLSAAQVQVNQAGASNVGQGNGNQFITGGCVADNDCGSGCCAQVESTGLGVCSNEVAALQNGKTGCGFSDPNAAAVIAAAQAQVEEQGFKKMVRSRVVRKL